VRSLQLQGKLIPMPRKSNPLQIKVALPTQKAKPRGRHNHAAWNAHKFKPGQSGNPGGKPKVFQTFDAMLRERLMQPCPPLIAKQLGLRRGATLYDAIVAAQILNAATGDNSSFMAIHDIVEGKLPQRNLNLSMSAEAFLSDPGFREYLQQHHGEYLGQTTGAVIDGALPEVPAAETPEGD
jgi:hypothetical protein